MKEAYVSFEVAKLLKEKGFDWGCCSYWCTFPNGDRVHTDYGHFANHNGNETDRFVSRPTQQMACRWLREEKGIFVDIRVYSGLPVQFGYDIIVLYPDKTLVYKGGTFGYSSYEEATEKGLKYVLQNLSKYL